MTPAELDAIAESFFAPDDNTAAYSEVDSVPALIAALRQAWAEQGRLINESSAWLAGYDAALQEGRAAVAEAAAEVERASTEVARANRALLASNAARDSAQAEVRRLRYDVLLGLGPDIDEPNPDQMTLF